MCDTLYVKPMPVWRGWTNWRNNFGVFFRGQECNQFYHRAMMFRLSETADYSMEVLQAVPFLVSEEQPHSVKLPDPVHRITSVLLKQACKSKIPDPESTC